MKKFTPDIIKLFNCHKSTAEKWAAKNQLETVVIGKRQFYLWGDDDIARFAARPKPGRRWPGADY
jgi:hypothetical protein